jgi:beta-lactamase regulating signal transducer with metallopeptidase domain
MDLINDPAAIWFLNVLVASASAATMGLLAERMVRSHSAPLRYGIILTALFFCLAAPGTAQLAQRLRLGFFRCTAPAVSHSDSEQKITATNAPAVGLQPAANAASKLATGGEGQRMGLANAFILVLAIGMVSGLFNLLRGVFLLRRLRRFLAPPRDERLQAAAQRSATLLGLQSIPSVRISQLIATPLSVGIFSPVIVFPNVLEHALEDDELDGIMLHETAHIAHRDHLVGAIQRIAGILFWWNPLVLLLNSRAADIREEICDNYVIKLQGSGERFARCLVDLAERTTRFHRMPLAVGLLHPRQCFEARVKDLLRKERNTMTKLNLGALSIIVVFAGVSCGWLAVFNVRAEDGKNQIPPAPEEAKADLEWNADNVKLDTLTNTFVLEGHAVVTHGGTTVHADRVSISRQTGVMKLSGHVRIPSGDTFLMADDAELNLKTGKLDATGVTTESAANKPVRDAIGTGASSAGTVARIEIHGLTRTREADVLSMLKTKVGQPFGRKIWDEDFHRLYDSGLFLNVRTTEPTIENGKVTVSADLTERAIVSKLIIEGNVAIKSDDLLKAMHTHEGGVFEPGEVHKDKARIQGLYEGSKRTAKVDYSVETQSSHRQTTAGKEVDVQDEVQIKFKIEEK